MKSNSAKDTVMIRVLMNRFHQGAPDTLLVGLPAEASKAVIATEVASQEPSKAIISPLELIKNRIHYSWLTTALDGFSMPMRSLLISSLPHRDAEMLSKLTTSPLVEEPAPVIQNFLFGLLYEKFKNNDILPAAFLPETPLMPLLTLSKQQLVELIDFLSIYDLSQELRKIVDKTIIQGINSALTAKQLRFLKICMHQKEKISTSRIGLKNWKGDKEELLKILHRRGLTRLGGALSGQDPGLIWYIVHCLDKGRGTLLESSCSKNEIPGASSVLIQQVLNVINFIKKMDEA